MRGVAYPLNSDHWDCLYIALYCEYLELEKGDYDACQSLPRTMLLPNIHSIAELKSNHFEVAELKQQIIQALKCHYGTLMQVGLEQVFFSDKK